MSINRFLRRAIRVGRIDGDAMGASLVKRPGLAPFALAVVGLAGVHGVASAQQPPAATLEEVVVTGSSIAQKAEQSSLPVTILTDKDIAKTGLNTATDLLQNLPAMQNFVPASSSVNG